ncbi:PepSY domain-containing protein [Sinorhizobium sp. BG8]|uniref:PepSY domain-containing protein n=1 Tax=Sinorhizobium sp. BG8 TaxID=2613773 RepID=UPI00193D8403|nr:PepSY domain-containing protein [Sinorhizobium sp. BG8]QRM56552.1 PepSY domain-containing protein [Sinorhizobium sp. BG8]
MKVLLAALTINAALAGAVFAAEKCDEPLSNWQPREALKSNLEKEGWKVRSIKSEDGCYEAYAINAKGEKVEAYFNPKSLDAVETKIED